MKILSWNCQGLGNPRAVQALRRLVVAKGPTIVFLSETRCNRSYFTSLSIQFGFDDFFAVDACGKSGGLCLLWKNESTVAIRSSSLHHIDVEVGGIGDPEHWRLTGFYGHPAAEDRHKSWSLLRRLDLESRLPWVCLGDFNELLCTKEKEGGAPKSIRQVLAFRQTLSECGLVDLGFDGTEFTWFSTRLGGIKERLDRAVANSDWQVLFPESHLLHLEPSRSDHLPILLSLRRSPCRTTRPSAFFRFESMWTQHEDCESVIADAWATTFEGTRMFQVFEKIKATRLRLLQWQRTVFQATQRDIQCLRAQLGSLWAQPSTEASIETFRTLSAQLDTLLDREASYWQQRAKVSWLKDGDRNTRFFHQRANNRRKCNKISGLRDSDGVWKEEESGIQSVVVDYFSTLFQSSTTGGSPANLDMVEPRVTSTMNDSLMLEFTELEVKQAVFQMYPTKAPGPDGMPPLFYQKYWHIVGPDVSGAVIDFLSTGHLLRKVNFTQVVLIPKVPNPKDMTQLRPISLCNVLFKIVSKVLANRLKVLLPSIISPSQSAFISGRLISDNSLLATEILHCLRSRRRGPKGFLALKLDMSKAYDRIEWTFLEQIMLKLGFTAPWVRLVLECVTTVSYSFLVNGSGCGYLSPSRGLRQGDPLSPYLFLLCAQGFSSYLEHAERSGALQGVSICRGAPPVSHLFFADDCFLFARATLDNCRTISEALAWYELVAGQKINFQKSAISFSKNVKQQARREMALFLGVEGVDQHHQYLGLPMNVGRSKSVSFTFLKERLGKKLYSWRRKLLSGAGKEILIKTVAQALPLYTMSCYLLPKSFCADLHRLLAGFWWGGDGGERKIHWLAWDKLCAPKDVGGLGFRDLFSFNLAMLAKQGWRVLQFPDSLTSKILKAKYFPNYSFLDAPVKANSSYVWKSICTARSILLLGSRWQVGSGNAIDIWKDPWVPRATTFRVITTKPTGCVLTRVQELIREDTRKWDLPLLATVFLPPDVEVIRSIPLSIRRTTDTLIWHFDKKGSFSVKSAYKLAFAEYGARTAASTSSGDGFGAGWNTLWKAKVQGKIKLFWWRVCRGILPTKAALHKRKVPMETSCVFCGAEVETSLHILRDCPFARGVWLSSPLGRIDVQPRSLDLLGWFLYCAEYLPVAAFDFFLYTGWAIWNARNELVWNSRPPSPAVVSFGAMARLSAFSSIHVRQGGGPKPPTVAQRWTKPQPGWVKINVDGSWVADTDACGIGVVARDSDGAFLAGKALHVTDIFSAVQAEAVAAREGAVMAVERGFPNFVIESDSLQIVTAVRTTTTDRSVIGPIVEDTKSLLATVTGGVTTHIRRTANTVADRLARIGRNIGAILTWFEEPPDFIVDLLFEDCI